MAKLHTIDPNTVKPGAQGRGYMFWCPGCECGHYFLVRTDRGQPSWTFDDNMESPTVSPSISTAGCHFHLRNGQLEFLSDCKHKLAGQTVPLPDWDDT